ncbi:hypothetical protein B0A52_09642 [Exophiala mesophila]|uniref:Uncharacterized protein n=1 Tax=Exophiala mesophila TaxID=212818 RepID=A0A438MRY0_EXOME|nr:hypothetical protein B0A52_09642 [Exophiala mesophila]
MASPEQRIVLITGANQGLGYEAVKKLAAEHPNNTILLGSRNIDNGIKAAESITKIQPGTVIKPIQIAVDSDSSIAAAVETVTAEYGRLDVLFNNAGIGTATGSPREEFLKILEVNAVSAALVTDAFLPLLKKAKVPRILFMSSGLGSISLNIDPSFPYYGTIDNKAYLTSKAAMNMIAVFYAVQLGKEGFKVNAINPGFCQTNLTGYAEAAMPADQGIIESVQLIVDDDPNGQTGKFQSTGGQHLPW